MQEFQVTCIIKPDRYSTHEHITHIGNIAAGWMLTREAAIRRIDAGLEAFFTIDQTSGRKVYVQVVREVGKNPYLKTQADGRWPDNLLAQAECTSACRVIA